METLKEKRRTLGMGSDVSSQRSGAANSDAGAETASRPPVTA